MADVSDEAIVATDAEAYSGLSTTGAGGVAGIVVARLAGLRNDDPDGGVREAVVMFDSSAAREVARMLSEAADAADQHCSRATNTN